MNNIKTVIIAILLLAVIVLAYMLFVSAPKKAEAACTKQITEVVIPEATAQAGAQCAAMIQQCQTVVNQLSQIPACAAAMPAQQ